MAAGSLQHLGYCIREQSGVALIAFGVLGMEIPAYAKKEEGQLHG
jgi:hypothetical protein